MPVKGAVLAALIVTGLVVVGAVGFFARASEVSALQKDLAKAVESKGMLTEESNKLKADLDKAKADLAKAIESKGMLTEENKKLQVDLQKAKEALLTAAVAIAFAPESGRMFHDGWLFIAPIGGGKFVLIIHAEGLDAKGPDDVYIVEGVTRTEPMRMVPVGPTIEVSEFKADKNAIGNYYIILDKDPRTLYDKILILLLPGMSMERARLEATAKLG